MNALIACAAIVQAVAARSHCKSFLTALCGGLPNVRRVRAVPGAGIGQPDTALFGGGMVPEGIGAKLTGWQHLRRWLPPSARVAALSTWLVALAIADSLGHWMDVQLKPLRGRRLHEHHR